MAVAFPAPSKAPKKFMKGGVLIEDTTKVVKTSQFKGRVARPPGSRIPGWTPETPPRRM